MKKHVSHTSQITVYDSLDELPKDLKELMVSAQKALPSSYSPYSGFQVASALKLESGQVVLGSNQENIAYPSGLCAERVAIFSAGTNFTGQKIQAIAITANSLNGPVSNPVTPCGSCRQVMIEIEHTQQEPISVVMMGSEGEIWVTNSIKDLIPFYFTSDRVNRNA